MRLIITGGSGLLALNWAYVMRDKAEISLFTHNHQVRMNNLVAQRVNLEDFDQIVTSMRNWRADLVIHTASMTNVDVCERQPDMAMVANAYIAGNVAKAAALLGISHVHISTDHLFRGNKPLADENEPPLPVNVYGRTKMKGEELVREAHPESMIVRTNFYGWGTSQRASISDWIIRALRAGKEIKMFDDVFFTPTLIDDLVNSVHELVSAQVSGVINLTGDDRVSKYSFACKLAEIFALPQELIRRSCLDELALLAPRPYDLSLSNKKAKELLGRSIGALECGLLRLREQIHEGRPSALDRALIDITV